MTEIIEILELLKIVVYELFLLVLMLFGIAYEIRKLGGRS